MRRAWDPAPPPLWKEELIFYAARSSYIHADPHGDECLFRQAVQDHIARPCVSGHLRMVPFLEWDSMVPDILSDRSERVSAKKGGAAARFRPKF